MQTQDAATVVTVLEAAGQVGVTPCLWGDPGIGKSAAIEALARAQGVPCETVLGSLCEPADIGGLPVVGDGQTEHQLSPPPWARRLREAEAGVLFLDELTTVPPAVQAAMLGVVFGRRVGNLRLPAAVQVIAAANPPDRAADGQELPAPMANRLLHIDYAPTAEAWFEGMVSGFAAPAAVRAHPRDEARTAASRAAVVAFLQTRPELLHAYPQDDAHAIGRAWPSRRTWQLTADVLAVIPDDAPTAREVAAAGLVGDGAAEEFRTWREQRDLPHPADVIAAPDAVAWGELDPSATVAVIGAVVAYAAGLGTIDGWRAGWEPLGVAADHGRADVAAWGAHRLGKCRPPNATPPRAARKFADVLARMNAERKSPARGDEGAA